MDKRFEPSEELLKLIAFFTDAPADGEVSFDSIAAATGVPMNVRGKELMRSALRSLKREYRSLRGWGVQLEGVGAASPIVATRASRSMSSVKKLAKTSQNMFNRYAPQLPKDERDRIGLAAAAAGLMIEAGRSLRDLYRGDARTVADTTKVQLPSPEDDPFK